MVMSLDSESHCALAPPPSWATSSFLSFVFLTCDVEIQAGSTANDAVRMTMHEMNTAQCWTQSEYSQVVNIIAMNYC